jgi:cephalosporin hydroxylase
MELWRDFLAHQGKPVHKWTHYFPAYERHFAAWQGRTMTFFEIGVFKGGSLPMWRSFFGPRATIVGIDIDPGCKEHEAPGIEVRIGDQSDPAFLNSLITEFGAPDVVLDDGSHQAAHVSATFEHLYPRMPKNAVYMVEDAQTSYWPENGGGLDEPEAFINIAKGLVDRLNAEHTRGAVPVDDFTRQTHSISFFDSIVVFEKGAVRKESAQISTRTAPDYFPTAKPDGMTPEYLFRTSLKARLRWLLTGELRLRG